MIERAKSESKALTTVSTLDTPSPGDVTPQASGARTPTAAIPIPQQRSTTGSQLQPGSVRDGGYSYTTASTSPGAYSQLSQPMSSSLTSTSSSLAPTASGNRPPPNSFAQAGMGALGLQSSDGHALELGSVDSNLERISKAGEASSSLGVPSSVGSTGYFSYGGPASSVGLSPAFGTEGLHVPPASPGGFISSSEDEDEPEDSRAAPLPKTPGDGGFGDPNKVIISGYLMKQGKRKNWRKRWFVLMSTRLVYSRSHMVRLRLLEVV
jgi:hypothetical protein